MIQLLIKIIYIIYNWINVITMFHLIRLLLSQCFGYRLSKGYMNQLPPEERQMVQQLKHS